MSIFLNYLNEQLNIIIEECKQEESYKTKINTNKLISNESIDIDDLVEFIQYDDNPKKKNKKKKKIKNTCEDKEIEEFKLILLNNTEKAKNEKIKPIFSQEWITSLRR